MGAIETRIYRYYLCINTLHFPFFRQKNIKKKTLEALPLMSLMFLCLKKIGRMRATFSSGTASKLIERNQ